MGWIEGIRYRRVNRTQTAHSVHDNFVSAQSDERCRAERMMWYEDNKSFRELADYVHHPPRYCARSAIAMDEQVHPLLCGLYVRLQVTVEKGQHIVSNLNLEIPSSRGDIRDHQPPIARLFQCLQQLNAFFFCHNTTRPNL